MPNPDKEVQAFNALEEFISATATARTELRKLERYLRRGLDELMGGEALESFIASKPPAERRQATWDALDELSRARHNAREKVFALAIERGLSVTELARAWGISRQLASRFVCDTTGSSGPVSARTDGQSAEEETRALEEAEPITS